MKKCGLPEEGSGRVNKPGFMIYSGDWSAALDTFSDKELGAVFRALLLYHSQGSLTEFSDRAVGLLFKQTLAAYDRDSERYAEICEKRQQAAAKRWGDANASKCMQMDANDANTNINSNCNSNTNSSSNTINGVEVADAPKRKMFMKPTIEEIQKYCIETGRKIDVQRFFDFYESNGWKVGRNPMKDWKAAVRNWERNYRHDRSDTGSGYDTESGELHIREL